MVRMLVCWTITALFLVGCAANLPPLPPSTARLELSEVIAQRQQLPNSTYTFGPEDVLRITVYDHPDLSHEVTIATDGTFTYPLLGKFQAAGLTAAELEQRLTQRLADGYLVNPQLTVVGLQYRSYHVYVIGAVQKPGVYPLHSSLTLLELISQAGGITSEAGWMPSSCAPLRAPTAVQSPPRQARKALLRYRSILTSSLPGNSHNPCT